MTKKNILLNRLTALISYHVIHAWKRKGTDTSRFIGRLADGFF